MFGLGAWEIALILLVALIFIGPKKLPEVASQLGKGMRDLQRAANDFKREITYPSDPPPYDPARDPYRELAQKKAAEADDPALSESDGEDDDGGGYPDIAAEDAAEQPALEDRNAPPKAAPETTATLRPGEPPRSPADNVQVAEAPAKPALPTLRPADGAVNHGAADLDDPPESTTTKG